MAAMSNEEIVAAVGKAANGSSNYANSALAAERIKALQYYRGELPKVVKGRSEYVSRDVYDSVDAARAQLLEAYSGNNRLIRFAPLGPDDIEAAREATEYCAHAFFQMNDGAKIQYNAITDGLVARVGIVKVISEEEPGEEMTFQDLTETEIVLAVDEAGGELVSKDPGRHPQTFKGTYRKKTKKRLGIYNVPPEEILMSPDTQDLQTTFCVIHRHDKTRSQLKQMGYDPDVVDSLPTGPGNISNDPERQERFKTVGGYIRGSDFAEEAKTIMVDEAYIYLDLVGTGIADLWKICIGASSELLCEPEKLRRRPFEEFVPLPTPYTVWGENYANNLIPIQNARTTIIRGILDHTVITNNPRLLVKNGTLANPAELMENRFGGLVNVRDPMGVIPMPQSPLNPFVLQILGLLDEDKEETTGISKLSQGLNKDALSKQNSQEMVQDLITVSQQRFKVIARQFGEFMKRTFLLIYDTALDHMDEQEIVDIAGSFSKVDPAQWRARKVATLELALGYNEREKEAMKWINIDQYLSGPAQVGPSYGPAQKYEVLKRALSAKGVVDFQTILIPPDKVKPPEPSPAEQLQLRLLEAQVKLAEAQAGTLNAKAHDLPVKTQAAVSQQQHDAALKDQEFKHKVAMDLFEQMMLQREGVQTKGILSIGGS